MPPESPISKKPPPFNKNQIYLEWPRTCILIIGILLLFLSFGIAGMEVGHTIMDFRRSTAFGGFIVFIPLLVCGTLVVATAFKPSLRILRVSVIICMIMIFLSFALIGYDILVLVDPSRCFIFDCNDAPVYKGNSTNNRTLVGWPLNVPWPSYFQTNMTYKRIFQSVQILCASFFIIFSLLYLLIYFIYRHVKLDPEAVHILNHRNSRKKNPLHDGSAGFDDPTASSFDSQNRFTYPSTHRFDEEYSNTRRSLFASNSQVAPIRTTTTSRNIPPRTSRRPPPPMIDHDELCTNCRREPRMTLRTSFERDNYFDDLCVNCNDDFANSRQRPPPRKY